MHKKTRYAAIAATMSSLALIAACGGGGGSSSSAPTPPAPAPAPPPPPPVNTAPTFSTQSLATSEETAGSAQLTANDAQNQTLTFALATPPQHGNATLSAAGVLSYTPAANYSGSDSLTVTVTDSAGAQTTGTVNLTVTNVNDAPMVQNDELRVAVTPGQPIVLTPMANDQDADGDTLTPTIVTQPAQGGTIAVDAATHAITFQSANDYRGPIEFTYRVNDGTVDSSVATVRAVIGDFENLIFLSDYSTPGIREVHVYDGFQIRRVSDPVPAGGTITTYTVSNDSSTLAYVVSSTDADRVYVKPVAGNSPAVVRYTSARPVGATFGVSGGLNADGTFMWVYDGYYAYANQERKEYFVFDTATGTARQLAGDMSSVIDIRLLQWHSHEANLLMVQGQTGGSIPLSSDSAVSAFLGDASGDIRTLKQIGQTYGSGEHGSGEGFYFGPETRYIYHTEYKRTGADVITNLLRYDRQLETTTAVVRIPAPPDRGMNGVVWTSPDRSRMCFAYYEQSTTSVDGPSRFYAATLATPGSEMPVTAALSDLRTCQFASDNRTMIYRVYSAPYNTQQAYAVDSLNPGTIRPLVPSGEANSEQANWQAAPGAMRIAVAYFDNDGVQGVAQGETGRFYSMRADGTGDAFLFADHYQLAPVSNFFASNADGSFIIHSRTQAGVPRLEIMSTRALNCSVPLSASGETLGVQNVRWMRRY